MEIDVREKRNFANLTDVQRESFFSGLFGGLVKGLAES